MLSFYLRPDTVRGLPFLAPCMPRSSNPQFSPSNNIPWRVKTMELFIMTFRPVSVTISLSL